MDARNLIFSNAVSKACLTEKTWRDVGAAVGIPTVLARRIGNKLGIEPIKSDRVKKERNTPLFQTKRYNMICALREKGKTWREIGEKFGISPQRAQSIGTNKKLKKS